MTHNTQPPPPPPYSNQPTPPPYYNAVRNPTYEQRHPRNFSYPAPTYSHNSNGGRSRDLTPRLRPIRSADTLSQASTLCDDIDDGGPLHRVQARTWTGPQLGWSATDADADTITDGYSTVEQTTLTPRAASSSGSLSLRGTADGAEWVELQVAPPAYIAPSRHAGEWDIERGEGCVNAAQAGHRVVAQQRGAVARLGEAARWMRGRGRGRRQRGRRVAAKMKKGCADLLCAMMFGVAVASLLVVVGCLLYQSISGRDFGEEDGEEGERSRKMAEEMLAWHVTSSMGGAQVWS